MAFTLEITVTGLCVFVPDPTNQQTHIFMVDPGHDPAHRHYPRLFYDAVHDGGAKRKQFWRMIPLDRVVLDLTAYSTGGVYGDKLSDIPDLVNITGDVDLLPLPYDEPKPGLACLVTLPLATKKIGVDAKPGWRHGQKPVRPAGWLVKWTVQNVPGDTLSLQLRPLKKETVVTFPIQPLKSTKIGNRKVIGIHLSNVVLAESAPPDMLVGLPPAKGKMPHFEAYGEFYRIAGPITTPWPDLVYTGPTAPVSSGRGRRAKRGTPYSCLPSGGK
jgi:hypothetical protein